MSGRPLRPRDPSTGSDPAPAAAAHRRGLVVFTKPAVPGRVKTRLIGELSAEQAAELHRAFLDDVLRAAAGAAVAVRLAWALEDGEEIPAEGGWRQEGADLGERLFSGLERAARTWPLVAAVGSDHPELAPADLEAAFEALERGAPVALRPSDDGGYTLIGLRREALSRGLFEGIAWSTDSVLAEQLDRCREHGLEPRLLPPGHDVDTPADLAALGRRLQAGSTAAPATRRVLRRWGRLAAPPAEA